MSLQLCGHFRCLRLITLAHRRKVCRARLLHCDHEAQKEKIQGKEEGRWFVHDGIKTQEYKVLYNPGAYKTRQCSLTSSGTADTEEELMAATSVPSFRWQRNLYTVSSSRHLSSTKNTLLDLAFNQVEGAKLVAEPVMSSEELPPDVRGDPRAFQKCRPEYALLSYNLSFQPPPISTDMAYQLLHKVVVLKGCMSSADITCILKELGSLSPEQQPLVQSDTRFSMLLRYSVESLRHFSCTQLLEVLQAFVQLGVPATHSILSLYETELSSRAQDMNLQQLLLAADLWRCLGRQVPDFLERLYNHSCQVLDKMGIPELVQLLYIIGEGRRCPPTLLPQLEVLLLKYLKQLLPEEVGAVSLALFKSQSTLSSGAARRLADRANEVVAELSDFALVNVLKLLRFNHIDHRGLLWALRSEIPQRAPQMGVQGLMHVTLACSALHYRDDDILLAVAKCLPPLALLCRSKDAGKLLWAFGMLGFPPSKIPQLYPCLTQALRLRKTEFQRFPQHLLTGLLGLAFVGLYPYDLLNLALSPEFVTVAAESQQLDLKKDLFTLDASVGLEVPNWSGPRINADLGKQIGQQLWSLAQQDVCVKTEVLEAEGLLQELFGGETFVRKHMILPHTRSIDIELQLDIAGNPVALASECRNNGGGIKRAPSCSHDYERSHTGVMITEDLLVQLTNTRKSVELPPNGKTLHSKLCKVQLKKEEEDDKRMFASGVTLTAGLVKALTRSSPKAVCPSASPNGTVQRIAVQIPTKNHYCYQSQQLLGLQVLKRRQLRLVGYRVVDLAPWEWPLVLRRTHAEKLSYLYRKIFRTQS